MSAVARPRAQWEALERGSRIERAVVVARWLAVGLALGLGPFVPNIGEPYVLALAAFIVVYDRLLALAAARSVDPRRLSVAALSLDAVAVVSALFILSPQPTWDARLVVPLFLFTAAFRRGTAGTAGALALLGLAHAAISVVRERAFGYPLQGGTLALELGLYAVAAVLAVLLLRELDALRSLENAMFEPLLRAQDALGEALLVRTGSRLRVLTAAFERLTGYRRGEVSDLDALMRLVPEGERAAALERIATASQGRFDMSLVRKDGQHISVEIARNDLGDASSSQIVLVRDVTERKRALDELEHRAMHDSLTDLPNAAVLKDRARQAIAESKRRGSAVSLLIVALDALQEVNELVGLTAADRIVVEAGARLRKRTRETDTVARMTSDAFAVLLPDCDEEGARRVASTVVEAVAQPFDVGARIRQVAIRAFVGVANWPRHAEKADDLIRAAEAAVRRARREDEGYVMYAPDQEMRTTESFSLLAELRAAIRDGQLVLHYQPIVSLRDMRAVTLEALVRWQHPQRGLLAAGEFIAVAERGGLIRQLTEAVLVRAAMDVARSLSSDGTSALGIAINLSARNLRDERLAERIRSMLRTSELSPQRCGFEVTETAVMTDPERSLRTLNELRALGVGLMLDDFGTGQSSFAYLQRLPVQGLKIDRSFVAAMATDKASAAIVRATCELAKHLGLEVVAEGVEETGTLEMVKGFGADMAQGYGIARPMPPDAVAAWAASHERALIGAGPEPVAARS